MLVYCLFNHNAKIHSAGPLCAWCCTNTEENVIPASLFPLALNLLSYLVVSSKRTLRPTCNSCLVSDCMSGSQLHSQGHTEGPVQSMQTSRSKYSLLPQSVSVMWLFSKPRSYDLQASKELWSQRRWDCCSLMLLWWQYSNMPSWVMYPAYWIQCKYIKMSKALSWWACCFLGQSGSALCFSDSGRCAQKGVEFGRSLDHQWAGSYLIKSSMLPLFRHGQTALMWLGWQE